MTSNHRIHYANSGSMSEVESESVALVVTSPPYPMIEMWDEGFRQWNPEIAAALGRLDGNAAFELMNRRLDLVWEECHRVLKPGAFACVNIGDAARRVGTQFRLYSNHTRVTRKFVELGFDCLPVILWRKHTNSPTKFMGSGMLPSGAYVTLEHEYILIFRKGTKRVFTPQERERRQESAFFWEERNVWFSDLWDFGGASQVLKDNRTRSRSAAFPLELAHRLIAMYSIKGDTVLDPFLGTGTTLNACILNNRNCTGYEIDSGLSDTIAGNISTFSDSVNQIVAERIHRHLDFIDRYTHQRGKPKYRNIPHGFPVISRQEQRIQLEGLSSIEVIDKTNIRCSYSSFEMDSLSSMTKCNTNGRRWGGYIQ